MSAPKSVVLEYLQHGSVKDLSPADQELVLAAHEAALMAYAPYSKFLVGAALRTKDGVVVIGSNQENASFPAGICAERTALHSAMAQDPTAIVETMAIVVPSVTDQRPVTPCGICRQALLEQEQRQGRKPMRLLMTVPNGSVYELASAGSLLPLSFDASFLEG
jgi:cytidine deaminase